MDNIEYDLQSAIENMYSTEKTTYKELSEIIGISRSPVIAPESNIQAKARTVKETKQPTEDSPLGTRVKKKRIENGKVNKVGGALSQRRRIGAT